MSSQVPGDAGRRRFTRSPTFSTGESLAQKCHRLSRLVEDREQGILELKSKEILNQIAQAFQGAAANTAVPLLPDGELKSKAQRTCRQSW